MNPRRSKYCAIAGIAGALAMALCLAAGAKADDPSRETSLKAPPAQPPIKFTAHPGKLVEGMTLKAALVHSVVRPGGPVVLRLALKNNITKMRVFNEIVPDEDFTLRIVDPLGHVTLLLPKPQSPRYATGSISLHKGEATKVDYRVDAVFAFSEEGRYTITAGTKWLSLRGDRVVDLISNTVVLQVKRPTAPAQPKAPKTKG